MNPNNGAQKLKDSKPLLGLGIEFQSKSRGSHITKLGGVVKGECGDGDTDVPVMITYQYNKKTDEWEKVEDTTISISVNTWVLVGDKRTHPDYEPIPNCLF